MIVRGEGSHVYDDNGGRYIDGLSGLYCLNLGHSHGEELGAKAAAQMSTLAVHVELDRRPPAGNRACDEARRDWRRTGSTARSSPRVAPRRSSPPTRWPFSTTRRTASLTAARRSRAATRTTACRSAPSRSPASRSAARPSSRFAVPTSHVSSTNAYRHPAGGGDEAAFTQALLDEIEETIEFEQPETIAMIIMEPVQNAGGSIVPPAGYWQGLREICDKHGILLLSDEVICAFGRLGDLVRRSAPRLLARHHHLRQGPDRRPRGDGRRAHLRQGRRRRSSTGKADYLHGITFGGHPVGSAIALGALEIYEREGILQNVLDNEPKAREMLEGLKDIPIVGDVRGMGHFFAIEVVKDQATKEPLSDAEANWLLKDVLSDRLFERGLICRLDDRAEPIVQIAPPLVADVALFEEITSIPPRRPDPRGRAARIGRARPSSRPSAALRRPPRRRPPGLRSAGSPRSG